MGLLSNTTGSFNTVDTKTPETDAFFSQFYPLPTHTICLRNIHATVMFLSPTRPYNANIVRTFPHQISICIPCIILFKCPAHRSAKGIIVLTVVHMAIILSFMNCTANSSMFKGRSATLAMLPKMLRQKTIDVGHCRVGYRAPVLINRQASAW